MFEAKESPIAASLGLNSHSDEMAKAALAFYIQTRSEQITGLDSLMSNIRRDAIALGFNPEDEAATIKTKIVTVNNPVVEFEGFRLDTSRSILFTPSGKKLDRLPASESLVSYLLISEGGKVVLRSRLNEELNGLDTKSSNLVDVFIYRLRDRIGLPDSDRIRSVRGKGYLLAPRNFGSI